MIFFISGMEKILYYSFVWQPWKITVHLVTLADLLFIDGIEAVFRVALVLLQTHEEALLACDSFEQIMDYMKTSFSTLQTNQIGSIISQVIAINCSDNFLINRLTAGPQ